MKTGVLYQLKIKAKSSHKVWELEQVMEKSNPCAYKYADTIHFQPSVAVLGVLCN